MDGASLFREHPGGSDSEHLTRYPPEAIDATILCCPIIGQEFPITMMCLETFGLSSVRLAWLDPDYPPSMKYGMRDAIKQYWRGEKDLVHIDHDMLFTWEHLRDFAACRHDWCTCPYYSFEKFVSAPLGFAKFSPELQRRIDLDTVFATADACKDTEKMVGCYGDWWGFEWHLGNALVAAGYRPCPHRQVMNDHPITGIPAKPDKIMSAVDTATEEGRQAIIDRAHELWVDRTRYNNYGD